MSLIQAEQRNARVLKWWESWYTGDRSRRVSRMHAVNKACGRVEKVTYSMVAQ